MLGRWTAISGGRYQRGETILWTNWPIGGRNWEALSCGGNTMCTLDANTKPD